MALPKIAFIAFSTALLKVIQLDIDKHESQCYSNYYSGYLVCATI